MKPQYQSPSPKPIREVTDDDAELLLDKYPEEVLEAVLQILRKQGQHKETRPRH